MVQTKRKNHETYDGRGGAPNFKFKSLLEISPRTICTCLFKSHTIKTKGSRNYDSPCRTGHSHVALCVCVFVSRCICGWHCHLHAMSSTGCCVTLKMFLSRGRLAQRLRTTLTGRLDCSICCSQCDTAIMSTLTICRYGLPCTINCGLEVGGCHVCSFTQA